MSSWHPQQQQSRHLAMLSDDIMQLVVSSLDMESAVTIHPRLLDLKLHETFSFPLAAPLRLCTHPRADPRHAHRQFKARAVCKSWKKMVTEAGTEPLEAGVRGQSLVDGLQVP